MRPLIVYHADCADGFGAAWCAWHKFGASADYVPAHYGDAPPDCTGREVYVLDFSFPRDVLLGMREQAARLLVLDHHKTAQADLADLPFARFGLEHSGAMLAAQCFATHQTLAHVELVEYVQDRDLWQWELPHSRSVNAWLSSHEWGFERWDWLALELQGNRDAVIREGSAILRAANQYVDRQATKATLCQLGDYRVPVINATHCISELVGTMSEGHPFAASWFQASDGKFVYSLRSRGDFDVSIVAKGFGGGGHKGAAGFTADRMVHALPTEST